MTPTQHEQIAKGMRNIKAKANFAYHEYLYSCNIIGSYYSNRFNKKSP